MRDRLRVLAGCVLLACGAARAAPCGTVVLPSALGVSSTPGAAATVHPILQTGSAYEAELSTLVYRPLVWFDDKGKVDPARSLASVTTSADDTEYTVRLKPWRWSDGREIVAADVMAAWRLITELGPTYTSYGVGGIPTRVASVTATDAHTVVFRLRQRSNPDWFIDTGLDQVIPVPSHVWGDDPLATQQTLQSTTSFYRVGDGPFLLRTLALGRYAVFTPNPLFPGQAPAMRRLVIDFLEGASPLQALHSGELAAATMPDELSSDAAAIGAFTQVTTPPTQNINTIIPNLADPRAPFLADVRVRQAIARAIDQRDMIRTVFHGRGLPQAGFVGTAATDYVPPEFRDGTLPLSFDPAAAERLLDEAGWHRDNHGVRCRFTLLLVAGSETSLMIGQLITADLARVGIVVDLKQMDFDQILARMVSPKNGWDAALIGESANTTGAEFPDGTQFFASNSGGNLEHYRDARMDALLARAITEPGLDATFALERYVAEQQPMIFLPDAAPLVLARPGLVGFERMIGANGTWSPQLLRYADPQACVAAHA